MILSRETSGALFTCRPSDGEIYETHFGSRSEQRLRTRRPTALTFIDRYPVHSPCNPMPPPSPIDGTCILESSTHPPVPFRVPNSSVPGVPAHVGDLKHARADRSTVDAQVSRKKDVRASRGREERGAGKDGWRTKSRRGQRIDRDLVHDSLPGSPFPYVSPPPPLAPALSE